MRARAGARGCPDPGRAGFAAERRGPVLIPGLLHGSLGESDQMALGICEHRKRQVVRRDLCRWDHLLAELIPDAAGQVWAGQCRRGWRPSVRLTATSADPWPGALRAAR